VTSTQALVKNMTKRHPLQPSWVGGWADLAYSLQEFQTRTEVASGRQSLKNR
jgi:hypothetical protein